MESLYGRDAALRVLRTALAHALAGRGQLALISGDAGLGKSALASAIAAEADPGAVVTWGRAWEFADAPPYFPVWPCLRGLGIATTHDEGQQFQMWEQVLAALAAQPRPVVWLVEDLHAADLGTLDLMTFLAPAIRALRVLVVATTRAEDPRLTERKQQRLARMARDGTAIRLEPLADRDVAALAENVLGRPVPASALGRLADLTGGNPLFVVECARALRATGTLDALPHTVRQVIVERAALLPEATRHALGAGAVLGRDFSAAVAARVLESLPARVIDQLLPALRAGIVRELEPGKFQFSHTLVRDAIEDALADDDRARLHARASAVLAASGESADILVDRARHALAAARALDAAEVFAIVGRATELLEREGAHDRAFELAERIEQARAVGALPPASAEDRLRRAAIARAAGRSDATRRACEDVIARARSAGDGALFARAVLLLSTDVRPGVIDRAQVALLEEARALLAGRPPELACRVLARLATALQPSDDGTPLALAHEALRDALATGDDAAILDVLELGVWGSIYDPRALAAWCAQLVERARATADPVRMLEAHLWDAAMSLEAGDFAGFDANATRLLALAEQVGHPRHRWRPLLVASCRAIACGRYAESERYTTEVAQLAPLADDPALELVLAMHEIMRAKQMRRRDLVDAAYVGLEHAMRDVKQRELFATSVRASCTARLGDVSATRALLAHWPGVPREPNHVGLVAEAFALAGSDADRRSVRETLERDPRPEVFGGQISFHYDGSVDRLLGLVDASLGDLARAEASLRRAYDRAVARGHLPWVAQIGGELAAVLRRTGRDGEARPFAEESARIDAELGVTALADHAPVAPFATLVLSREAEVWTVTRGGAVARVKDSRGMQLLARLVERPGEEIHVLALASDEGTAAQESSSGEQLDKKAVDAYRRRLAELEETLATAEAAGNEKRATVAEREIAALRAELSRALGLGGRSRQAGSATERARSNVQRRLKDAVARIRDADAGLGAFLDGAVHTGTYCCFRP